MSFVTQSKFTVSIYKHYCNRLLRVLYTQWLQNIPAKGSSFSTLACFYLAGDPKYILYITLHPCTWIDLRCLRGWPVLKAIMSGGSGYVGRTVNQHPKPNIRQECSPCTVFRYIQYQKNCICTPNAVLQALQSGRHYFCTSISIIGHRMSINHRLNSPIFDSPTGGVYTGSAFTLIQPDCQWWQLDLMQLLSWICQANLQQWHHTTNVNFWKHKLVSLLHCKLSAGYVLAHPHPSKPITNNLCGQCSTYT